MKTITSFLLSLCLTASLASARELLDRAEAWRGGGAAVGSAGADRPA